MNQPTSIDAPDPSEIPNDFNDQIYYELHPDVANAGMDAKTHYILYGKKEGRQYKTPTTYDRTEPTDLIEPTDLADPTKPTDPTDSVDSKLLYAHRTEIAQIEFTSRCNLRCVYCAVSQPSYQGCDLNLEQIDDILDILSERKVEFVYVNGHGETTIIEGWESICRRMLDRGFPLGIIVNFSRKLKPSEIETLTRFQSICVSCDTVDPELFTQLRRKAQLSVLFENLELVQLQARKNGIPGPTFSWSCVVCDKNVFDLPNLVQTAISKGVKVFDFCNLTKYGDLPNALAIRHISTMDLESMKRAKQSINEAMKIANKKGCKISIQSGLLDALDQRIEMETGGKKIESKNTPIAGRYAVESISGTTRQCLDPWKMMYIHADNSLRPCCWHWDPLGKLSQETPLRTILNNDRYRQLRSELLTGNLNNFCQSCPARPLVPVSEQKRAVSQYLKHNSFLRG